MTGAIETLDKAGYRKFGLITSAIVVVLFGLCIPYIFSLNFPWWPWIGAAILSTWALLLPATLKPVYIGWMKFGNMMNWINTRLILGILFYGMFMPFGIVMRLFGKDPMHRKLDVGTATYRIKCEPDTRKNVEHPY